MEFAGFDWDHGNRAKCQKHGVSICESESLFTGTVFVSSDPKHSFTEERLKGFGTTQVGRNLLVTFTFRRKGEDVYIRPISSRYMHAKEVTYYEKETSKIEN